VITCRACSRPGKRAVCAPPVPPGDPGGDKISNHHANLDEPTNHLSFDVVESLRYALTEFQGPVITVTHDRRLIRQFPRTLWTVHEGNMYITDCAAA